VAIVGCFVRDLQHSDCLSCVQNRHNQNPCYRNVSFRHVQAFIRKQASFFHESSTPNAAPLLTRKYSRPVRNPTFIPYVPCHGGDNKRLILANISKYPILAFHGLQQNAQYFCIHFVIGSSQEDFRYAVPDAQLSLGLAEGLLGLFALGDVFSNSGDAVNLPGLIINLEASIVDPSDRPVRPHNPVLVFKRLPLSFFREVSLNTRAVIRVNRLNPVFGVFVQTLNRSPHNGLISAAYIDELVTTQIIQPKDLTNILR